MVAPDTGLKVSQPDSGGQHLWHCYQTFLAPPSRSVNLTNAILGAGMLAFPRAFAGLGLLGGGAMTVAVAIMTYASIAVMLR